MEDYREFDPYYDLNETSVYVLLAHINEMALKAKKYTILNNHMRYISNTLSGDKLSDKDKLKYIKGVVKAAREREAKEIL